MNSAQTQAKSNEVDLEEQPRVHVGCGLCGSRRSRLVCSPEDIVVQQRFLEHFYRSRWSQHNAATATDRVNFTQDYATSIVACMDCGLLYRNPRPRAEAVTQAYETEDYDEAYLQTSLLGILKKLVARVDPVCWKSAALSVASCLKDSYEGGTCSVWIPVMTSPHFAVGIGYPYSKERSRMRNFLRPHSTQLRSGTRSTSFRTLANCFTSCYR